MCRLAAYLGTPIPLKQFLFDPEHSLYVQSWQPKELHYAKLNADGFGFGWYQDDQTPACYRNSYPIWSDDNLPALAQAMKRNLWIGMVRSATSKFPINDNNTQPFIDQQNLFVHNGFIENFRDSFRHILLNQINASIEADIKGLTDSEYIFALVRQFISDNKNDTTEEIIYKTYQWLNKHLTHTKAMLNIIISEKDSLYAVRYAVNEQAPSLYSLYSNNATTIASERLDNNPDWQYIPDNTLVSVRRGQPPKQLSL